HVKKACISKVLALCDKLDEKRVQKTAGQDTEEDDEEDEDVSDPLEAQDPAYWAAVELLHAMEK
ncbi:unnamed protein product, partial [Symbiodinium microadriaticum]